MQIEFTKNTRDYLLEMCVDLCDLENHLLQNHPNHIDLFVKLIAFLVNFKLEEPRLLSPGVTSLKSQPVFDYFENNGIHEGQKEYGTADTLMHAFIAFKERGLLGLYEAREAEGWYPVVVITKNIPSGDSLDNIVTIYRGTSKSEYESNKYGQSWSISKKVAHGFAFVHYNRGQKIHENTPRVILQSTIRKEDVYYSDIDGTEKELIINPNKLITTPKILREETLDINKELEFES